MDTPKHPQKPANLLDDLESIRALLDDEPGDAEPPLLTETLDADGIPLLSEIVEPAPAPPAAPLSVPQQPVFQAAPVEPDPIATPTPESDPAPAKMAEAIRQRMTPASNPELVRLDSELRAAAQLILQDVIDDFVPQIEAELKRRLEARLTRLLPPRRQ
ncbi:DNA polymerase III subunit chi [Pseudomonas taiwanensis]|uniref:DNA polymerase III subunit chi n=1 Tax=Pseudomonas taiwanensis TaxID=470150 RepID=UPI0015BBA5A5|nr:DNA polymerase III subunit chi [Pseudomonas taiwanensis]NWL79868.1 DNA polymerase III subunit chi [Pseudomonas taiwanensis]